MLVLQKHPKAPGAEWVVLRLQSRPADRHAADGVPSAVVRVPAARSGVAARSTADACRPRCRSAWRICGSCLRPNRARPSWICSAILGSVRRSCRIPTARRTRGSPSATAGEMMDDMLGGLRTRLWNILAELHQIPDQMAQVLDRTRAQLPASERLRLIGAVIVFLAGGIVGQSLFFRLARPWRMHFGAVTLDTARERARVVSERLLIGMLVVAAFAAGSMGAFLLFAWPPLTGSDHPRLSAGIRAGSAQSGRNPLLPRPWGRQDASGAGQQEGGLVLASLDRASGRHRRHWLADHPHVAHPRNATGRHRGAVSATAAGADLSGHCHRLVDAASHGRRGDADAWPGRASAGVARLAARLAAVPDGRIRPRRDTADPCRRRRLRPSCSAGRSAP